MKTQELNHILIKAGVNNDSLDLVRDARGLQVYKIESDQGRLALKVIMKSIVKDNPDFDPTFRIASLKRESNFLKENDELINFFVASGEDSDAIWLITPWIDGLNSIQYINNIKIDGDDAQVKNNIVTTFSNIVLGVHNLHQNGIIHGDLQPAHLIFDDEGSVNIIDYGLSKKISDKTAIYKGGFVHYNSPEVAEAMLEGKEQIDLDKLSEIYSLGSLLFFLYTGKTSTDYGTDDYKSVKFEDKLKLISSNHRNSFRSTKAHPFPELEEILNWMMAFDRSNRCSNLADVLDRFSKIFLS